MGIDHVVAGAWEIDAGAGRFLLKNFATRSDRININIGQSDGDMLKVKPADVPDADCLLAGPPCPPWSSSGRMRGWKDVRALPCKHLFAWLRHLCQRKHPLRFFIIENVRGILGKNGGEYLDKLRAVLPKGWVLAALRVNSYCSAQTRPRVYLVGWKSKTPLSLAEATRTITARLPSLPRRNLSEVLLDLPNDDPNHVLSTKQACNFRKWMRRLQPSLKDKRKKGMVACFEADRNPCKSHATLRTDDLMMTLRASGHPIWLVSLGEGRCGPSISRLLTVEERCLLQGFRPSVIPRGTSTRLARHAMGNAMTVPVVGSVIGAILLQLQDEAEGSSGSADSECEDSGTGEGDSSSEGNAVSDDSGAGESDSSNEGECRIDDESGGDSSGSSSE